MIKQITIKNWRSHENTQLTFGAGTNLLVGIMGSGKTSVLDAISFALFGTFPALERRQLKLEDIIRYNANETKVSLIFEWNGSEYKVDRKIEKKNNRITSKADIYRDGSLLDSGSTAVTEVIEEVLDMDYDLFTRAIYSEQNNIDYFLSLDPKKRKDEFDRILGLDRFEKARAATVSIANRLESVVRSLTDRYDENKEKEIKENIRKTAEKEEELSKEITTIKKKNDEIKKEVLELKGAFELLEKNKRTAEVLSKELASLQGQVVSLEKGLTKIEEKVYSEKKRIVEQLRKKRELLQQNINENKRIEVEINKKIAFMEAKVKEVEQRAMRLEKLRSMLNHLLNGKSKDEIIKRLNESKREFEDKNSQRAALLQIITQTRELLKHLSSAGNKCPLCETALGAEGIERVRRKKEEEIKNAEKKAKEILQVTIALQEENKKIDENLRKIELIEQQIKSEEQQLIDKEEFDKGRETLKKQLDEVLKLTFGLENESKKLQQEIEKEAVEINKMEEMIRRETMINEIKKKILEVEEKQKKVKYNEEEYTSKRKELEEKRIEEQKLQAKIEYLEKEKKMLEENKKTFETQLNDMLMIKNRALVTKEVVEELKIYKNALLETQIELRRELIDAINNAMNEIWRIFYPYGNYKALRINITEKDYVFEVLENNEWKTLESTASGGERACAALTIRAALAMVLTPNLSWLILDEPTHNLDSQAIALLSETLQTKMPQVVKQIFVITHEEALIGADFSRTYKLTRDKESGEATKVEMI
ncbi:MAG: SMC family ATPase [Candidatus Bilamarchaeaceae archaeon]